MHTTRCLQAGVGGHLGTQSGSSSRNSSNATVAHPVQPRSSTKGHFASEAPFGKAWGYTPRGPSQGVPVASGERSPERCWHLHSPRPRPPRNQDVGSAEAGNQPAQWSLAQDILEKAHKLQDLPAAGREPGPCSGSPGVAWGPLAALGCELLLQELLQGPEAAAAALRGRLLRGSLHDVCVVEENSEPTAKGLILTSKNPSVASANQEKPGRPRIPGHILRVSLL